MLILTLLISILISPGFINNGPFERYTLGTNAALCLLAPAGLRSIWRKKIGSAEQGFVFTSLLLSFCFILVLNIATATLSHIGATSIYDFGFHHDQKIISLLNEKASGELAFGPHAPMATTIGDWNWPDRNTKWALEQEPDWLITYSRWIEVTNETAENVTLYRIGLYTVIHSHPRGYMHNAITVMEKPYWKNRGERSTNR